MSRPILVVGAGFAGATYARILAESGREVKVIDQRNHVAGNAFDEVVSTGTRVHRYGPHLFHTKNQGVVDWITQFGEFVPYEHRVEAELPDGRFVPVPVNRKSINAVFGLELAAGDEVGRFLASQAEPIPAPANAAEYLNASIGCRLTDIFFRPYTRKMWNLDLEDLAPAVVQRVPVRWDDETRLFPNDTFQALPRDGYTSLVEAILDHPGIRVSINCPFDHGMIPAFDHCFNSMAIDEFFGSTFGALPYRSIRFHHAVVARGQGRGRTAQINYCDDGPFTREIDWQRLPGHCQAEGQEKTVTREEPCDYRDNGLERYYPIKTPDGRYERIYRRYHDLASELGHVSFIGRCGTYQYLDMDQVINQSLIGARAWIRMNR